MNTVTDVLMSGQPAPRVRGEPAIPMGLHWDHEPRRRCRSADCRVCRFAGCQPASARPFVTAQSLPALPTGSRRNSRLGNLRYDRCVHEEEWLPGREGSGRSFVAGRLLRLATALALGLSFWVAPATHAADSDIVINELMYNPPDEKENLQYVEISNRGAAAVDLSQWAFTRGIRFIFPDQTRIEPDSYLVVCRSLKEFSAHYGKEVRVLGEFSGKLSHQGDRIELSNGRKQVVDWVKYSDRGEWPIAPDGYSPSLERICPNAPGQGAENWAPSRMPAIARPSGTPGKKNDSFSANLPPMIMQVEFSPKVPAPGQRVTVSANVMDSDGVQSVSLLFRSVTPKNESSEVSVAMARISGDEKSGVYSAGIDGQPADHLVRFRIRALDRTGAERFQPSENETRPSYSFYTLGLTNTARIPFGFVIQTGPQERPGASFQNGPRNRQPTGSPARGGNEFI